MRRFLFLSCLLATVVTALGLCGGCVGDIDADGIVTVADILLLLGNFGNPCP